jgi:hypothetical protein
VEEHHLMRASDADRQAVIDRLQIALEDGRLKIEEYVERMGKALEAVTYGDLATLHADLPTTGSSFKAPARPAAAQRRPRRRTRDTGLPVALKVLWTIWLTAVLINIVIWVLVSATTGHLAYPWPLWVAGPSGAALLGVSAGVTHIRRGRLALPPGSPAAPGDSAAISG